MVVGCYIMKTNFKTHLGILMVTFPKHQYLYQYFLQKLSVLKVNAFVTGLKELSVRVFAPTCSVQV